MLTEFDVHKHYATDLEELAGERLRSSILACPVHAVHFD